MEKEYIIALNGQQKMDYEKVLEWRGVRSTC